MVMLPATPAPASPHTTERTAQAHSWLIQMSPKGVYVAATKMKIVEWSRRPRKSRTPGDCRNR